MPLRWLWVGFPLAVLVAVLAHVTAFGSDHAAGGAYATALSGILAGALTLRLGVAFARSARSVRGTFATRYDLGKSALLLAIFAALAFAGIELSEGHAIFGAGLVPLVALLPIAFLVLVVARRVDRFAARVGSLAAVYLRRPTRRVVAAFVRRSRSRAGAAAVHDRRVARGRAPPLAA